MNVRLIAIGKVKEAFLRQGIQEYHKRLQAYCRLEIIELKEESFNEPLSEKEASMIMDKEGERILGEIPTRSYVVALDRQGEQLDSVAWSQKMQQLTVNGHNHFSLVIGGSLGLAPSVLTRADWLLSFSKFTFPHQLMRLILMEQFYRIMTINRGEKYHK